MGTTTNEDYNIDSKWSSLNSKQLKKLKTSGIQLSANEIENCILSDNTFEWQGQKLIVYIKEQWLSNYCDKEYKYHISDCSTLAQMRYEGRFARYVISNRSDGIFEVTLRNYSRIVTAKNVKKTMNVCKNCLSVMQQNYPNKLSFFSYNTFDLKLFLEKYNTQINPIPSYNNNTVPDNDYPSNWKEISEKYREYKKWVCEKCERDCKTIKSELHCHHIGPKYDNNWESLKALCKNCHRLEPGHGQMF